VSLERLFTHNYEYLNTVAVRITRKKDYRLAPDLLNSTYLTIHEKASRGQCLIPGENEEFVRWFSNCMKNYFKWPNSDFNKVHQPKEHLFVDGSFNSRHEWKITDTSGSWRINQTSSELIVDEDALKDIEIQTEETNDFTKELIEISSSLGKAKTLRYIEVVEFKRSLQAHEAILFELYFEKEMSTRDIAKEYSTEFHTINYQSINKMVNTIKQKINNYKWTQFPS
jgi:hypothetical protein